ncbi:TIGR04282 family arsenosugar biosynthesis glycosyltransferase [Serpentinicella alkaliphila]|uniref:Glycosyltransferase A (GT-A) superfamily protein (DUF2064 family) n=1 Tax=Serpentinicella alkaliphila TaxID=1734049 RepID=A0A4R2TGM4_9FIRM|nr:TIGR04282 family arsenosugar biosynthesis glycosyltransferase [Serpentinicella alkaliphila]QUH24593.1 TIGR04282 family arsenosugar biosynthesis glycosyltransferase [Serpentinicella alkaliphila]TCQ02588.1 hypothetical protein EDD79_10142 [Serpentinicella alkaliphila]
MKALILMTRVPIPGCTKTRLMEILTGDECAELHKCFLMDLFKIFSFINDDIQIFLTYTPEQAFGLIKDMVPETVRCFPQVGDDLGKKMSNAFRYVFEKGYEKVCLMGADIPYIQPYEIKDSFNKLEKSDVVLGPTLDGGYYFIGIKKYNGGIFSNKLKWGNESVLEGTIDIVNNLDLKLALTYKHRDIDTKEDLFDLKQRADVGYFKDKTLPTNTITFINKLWSDKYNANKYIRG